ncbi:MAG: HAD-IIIC family phosphatase, partial [Steroidobacteraceae bacterium]
MTQAFLRVQEYAVEQQKKGILLCLASKNAERDVLEVFERRPDMALRLEHIIAHRVNWQPKSDNIRSLASELNLGLDSFVFLDDNPVECAQLRAALPQVVTLQLPPEGEIDAFLARLWTFDKVAITGEDLRRTSLYRENAARQQHENSTTDIAQFVASLELQIDISPPQDSEWPRVAQLTQRTNQFNFTTVRRSEAEMRAAQGGGSLVLRVTVRDRFGDYGLVGVLVANFTACDLVVDTLLLSCRVLGRGVEHAMLRRLGELAVQHEAAQVKLPYVRTSKNEPAGAFVASVAGEFASEERDGILYGIPAAHACGITHRPGYDPEAVTNARKAEEKKPAPSDSFAGSSSTANRSERYAKFALEFATGGSIIRAVRAQDARIRALAAPPARPATETEAKLASLWQELLNVDEIGVEDDYFALGGTSLLAARMFAEIARRFGVNLRLTAILDSPTVRSLARYIEPKGLERSANLVELKRGRGRHLFLVHDGDGETLLYRNLARRMPDEVAVFGIEPHRIAKVPLAHARIEDMARFYVEEVRREQPAGPYMLGGLCAGGVIAYEMGRQLKEAGHEVALVAIFDAASPHAAVRPGRLASQRVDRLKQMLANVGQSDKSTFGRAIQLIRSGFDKLVGFLSWQLSSRAKQLSTRIRFRVLREVLGRGLPWPSFLTALSVREIYDSAEAQYSPHPLSDAGVLLARASSGDGADTPYRDIFFDDTLGWREIAPKIKIVDVNGGHSSMLQEPFVESLASVIAQRVSREPTRRPATEALDNSLEPVSP